MKDDVKYVYGVFLSAVPENLPEKNYRKIIIDA